MTVEWSVDIWVPNTKSKHRSITEHLSQKYRILFRALQYYSTLRYSIPNTKSEHCSIAVDSSQKYGILIRALQCGSIGPGRPASRLWEMIIKAKSGAYRARYCRHINSLFHHQFASSRSEATMEWHFQSFPARFLRGAHLCRATFSASTQVPASNLGIK